jgi:hypothetical protein
MIRVLSEDYVLRGQSRQGAIGPDSRPGTYRRQVRCVPSMFAFVLQSESANDQTSLRSHCIWVWFVLVRTILSHL